MLSVSVVRRLQSNPEKNSEAPVSSLGPVWRRCWNVGIWTSGGCGLQQPDSQGWFPTTFSSIQHVQYQITWQPRRSHLLEFYCCASSYSEACLLSPMISQGHVAKQANRYKSPSRSSTQASVVALTMLFSLRICGVNA